MILSAWLFGEKFTMGDVKCIAVIICGCLICAAFGAHGSSVSPPHRHRWDRCKAAETSALECRMYGTSPCRVALWRGASRAPHAHMASWPLCAPPYLAASQISGLKDILSFFHNSTTPVYFGCIAFSMTGLLITVYMLEVPPSTRMLPCWCTCSYTYQHANGMVWLLQAPYRHARRKTEPTKWLRKEVTRPALRVPWPDGPKQGP